MAFGNFLTGNPATSQQFPTITPQQQNVKGAANNQALKMLQSLGGQNNNLNFEPIANRARTQFQTQTIPGIAERFTSLGQGAQRSSGFQGALGQAGSELEQGLAALGSQYGLQKQGLEQQLLSLLLGTSLSPEAETGINPEEPGFFQNFGSSILNLLPTLLGSVFGGPAGAAAGGTAGEGIKSLLNYFNKPSQVQTKQQFSLPQAKQANLPDYNALINNIIRGKF